MNRIAHIIILQLIFFFATAQPGALDTTFGTKGEVETGFGGRYEIQEAIAIQSDGKIIVAGSSGDEEPRIGVITVARYNANNGSLDVSFGNGGKVNTRFPDEYFYHGHSVAIRNDGKIIVAGHRSDTATNTHYTFTIARYNNDGTLDNVFGTYSGQGRALRIQNDGKLVVAGFSDNAIVVLRYNTNDGPDATFGTGGVVTTSIGSGNTRGNAVAVQNDGKIVVAGGNGDFVLARYTTNGTLDNSFGSGGIVTTDFGSSADEGSAIEIQSNGKIVVAGSTDQAVALARYNIDGSLDNSFGTGGKVTTMSGADYMSSHALAIQVDGKIIVAGKKEDQSSGVPGSDFTVVRYSANGNLDNTFGSGGISAHNFFVGDDALAVAIQQDGKILAAGGTGYTTGFNCLLVRYNNDASLGVSNAPLEHNPHIKVFPNPSNGMFTLKMFDVQSPANLTILDALGNRVMQKNCDGGTEHEIDLSRQPRGIYFAELLSGDKKYVAKITLE